MADFEFNNINTNPGSNEKEPFSYDYKYEYESKQDEDKYDTPATITREIPETNTQNTIEKMQESNAGTYQYGYEDEAVDTNSNNYNSIYDEEENTEEEEKKKGKSGSALLGAAAILGASAAGFGTGMAAYKSKHDSNGITEGDPNINNEVKPSEPDEDNNQEGELEPVEEDEEENEEEYPNNNDNLEDEKQNVDNIEEEDNKLAQEEDKKEDKQKEGTQKVDSKKKSKNKKKKPSSSASQQDHVVADDEPEGDADYDEDNPEGDANYNDDNPEGDANYNDENNPEGDANYNDDNNPEGDSYYNDENNPEGDANYNDENNPEGDSYYNDENNPEGDSQTPGNPSDNPGGSSSNPGGSSSSTGGSSGGSSGASLGDISGGAAIIVQPFNTVSEGQASNNEPTNTPSAQTSDIVIDNVGTGEETSISKDDDKDAIRRAFVEFLEENNLTIEEAFEFLFASPTIAANGVRIYVNSKGESIPAELHDKLYAKFLEILDEQTRVEFNDYMVHGGSEQRAYYTISSENDSLSIDYYYVELAIKDLRILTNVSDSLAKDIDALKAPSFYNKDLDYLALAKSNAKKAIGTGEDYEAENFLHEELRKLEKLKEMLKDLDSNYEYSENYYKKNKDLYNYIEVA